MMAGLVCAVCVSVRLLLLPCSFTPFILFFFFSFSTPGFSSSFF